MAVKEDCPQYLALVDQTDVICEAIQYSITPVAIQLARRELLARSDCGAAVRAVTTGHDARTLAKQMLEGVLRKVRFSPDHFYHLVDALNECEVPSSTGKMLEEHCGESCSNAVQS